MRRVGIVLAATVAVLSACSTRPSVDAPTSPPSIASPSASSMPMASAPEEESVYARNSRELLAIEAAKGPEAALRALGRRISRDPAMAGVCHAIAHDLGHAALEAAEGDVTTALRARDDVCGGGYTHGVIELALGSSKHPARDLLTVCAPDQDGSCFHGVGHGLMFATRMDVRRSLALCDRAPEPILSTRCGEGVFMQLFSADDSAHHTAAPGTQPPTPATARGICERTRQRYAANCWFYAPTVFLSDQPDAFDAALEWCAGAGTGPGRQVCARGVGSRTVKYHPDDLQVGAHACRTIASLTDSCLAGMASYWSVHHRGRREPSDVCHRLGSAALERRCLAVA